MVKNCKCLSCATHYSFCPNCNGPDKLAPAWKAEFCSEECKDLWLTATRFNMGMLTKSEAKDIISALDLKPIDTYVACVQRDYAKIMAEDKKPKRGKRIEIQLVDEVMDFPKEVIEELVEIKIEQPIEVVEPVDTDPVHEVVTQENE